MLSPLVTYKNLSCQGTPNHMRTLEAEGSPKENLLPAMRRTLPTHLPSRDARSLEIIVPRPWIGRPAVAKVCLRACLKLKKCLSLLPTHRHRFLTFRSRHGARNWTYHEAALIPPPNRSKHLPQPHTLDNPYRNKNIRRMASGIDARFVLKNIPRDKEPGDTNERSTSPIPVPTVLLFVGVDCINLRGISRRSTLRWISRLP